MIKVVFFFLVRDVIIFVGVELELFVLFAKSFVVF